MLGTSSSAWNWINRSRGFSRKFLTLPTHIDVLQTCSANAVEALVNFKTIDPLRYTEYSEYLHSIFTGRQRSGLTSFVLSNIRKLQTDILSWERWGWKLLWLWHCWCAAGKWQQFHDDKSTMTLRMLTTLKIIHLLRTPTFCRQLFFSMTMMVVILIMISRAPTW